MYRSFRHRFYRITGPICAFALLWLGLLILPASAATEEFTLSVLGEPETAFPGATAVFTVSLQSNHPITNTAAVSITLSGPFEDTRFELVEEATQGVRTQRGLRSPRGLRWGGQMASGGQITFRISTHIAQARAGDAVTVFATAGPSFQNLILQAQDSVNIVAPPPVPEENVLAGIELLDARGNVLPVYFDQEEGVRTIDAPVGQPLRARLQLTNSGAGPILSLLTGAFLHDQLDVAAQTQTEPPCRIRITDLRVRTGNGVAVPLESLDGKRLDYAFLLTTPPDTTTVAEMQLGLFPNSDAAMPENIFNCTLRSETELRYRALAPDSHQPVLPRRELVGALGELTPAQRLVIFIAALLSDVGDAPDSTNHPGLSMTAYPGITANFPTVFDPTTGLPQGPRHRFVRPLYLGKAVSWEVDADLAFFAANLNIDPPNDTADLDLHDDGVDVAAMSFRHCLTTLMPIEVTWTQFAINYLAQTEGKVYVNTWLDGNRDGEWDDVLDCDGIEAPEHIVIDHEIVAPGGVPGTYQYMVPTSNLPIPLNQTNDGFATEEMWLRVSLSEQPSVKTGQVTSLLGVPIDIGDGRGPAQSFLLGETEDYLARPGNLVSSRGADLALEGMIVPWDDIVSNDGRVNAELQFLKRLRLRNLGDAPAGGKLIIETTPYLGIPEVLGVAEVETAVPAQTLFEEVCTSPNPCRLEMNLAELPPGGFRELLLRWKVEEGTKSSFTAAIESAVPDANAANNSFAQTARTNILPLDLVAPQPGILRPLIRQPLTATLALNSVESIDAFATTASHGFEPLTATVTIGTVFGEPGASFRFKVNDLASNSYSLDAGGKWEGPIALPDANNLVALEYTEVAGWPEDEVATFNGTDTFTYAFQVTRELPWNPSSFGVRFGGAQASMTEQIDLGMVNIVDANGNAAANDWLLPAVAGKEMEVALGVTDLAEMLGIEADCCDWPPVSLQIGDDPPIPFQFQPDNPDRNFRAVFTLNEATQGAPVHLTIGCTEENTEENNDENPESVAFGQCWVFSGTLHPLEPGQIVDGETGQAVNGADFLIWQHGIADRPVPWPSGAFGQVNPVTTDANGEFMVQLPPGRYGITIRHPGYQPLRLGPLNADFFSGGIIALNPVVSDTPDRTITYSAAGFQQSFLDVRPGTIVRIVNAGWEEGVQALQLQAGANGMATESAIANTAIQSGLIPPGESFDVRFDTLGEIRLVNTQNPVDEIVIQVTEIEEPETTSQIFLPFMSRTTGE